MVRVGMGQHKIVQCLHIKGLQIIEQRILCLGGAGINQAVGAILTEQHGIPLPDIQYIHGGGAV